MFKSDLAMRQMYRDIIEMAGTPKWFDEFGVPRYWPFNPEIVANVHAREAALVRVHCRACGTSFDVAFSRPNASPVPRSSIAELIACNGLNFGDPPNTQCCSKAPYPGTVAKKVIEYWRRPSCSGWLRDQTLEVAFVVCDLGVPRLYEISLDRP
jgi:hypothetical protein